MDVSRQQTQRHDETKDNIDSQTGAMTDQGKQAFKDIIFGSFAGVIGKVIEYPFDTVKVRLQAQPDHAPLRYAGPLDCFKQSLKHDGFAGLYRGVSAPLVGAAVETSSLFFSYRVAQDILHSAISLPASKELPFGALILCGAASGAFTSVLLTPIELVKCKMQVPFIKSATVQRPPTVFSIMSSVYQHQGIRGFWHGQMGTLIRETGGSAAWFGSNEGIKLLFRKSKKKENITDDDLTVWQRLTAGALAGMSYNFLFYPADTIKSRMQTEDVVQTVKAGKRSFWSVGKAVWRAHGLKGLYRGCGITVARSAPSSAVIFTLHDALMKYFS